MTLRLNGSTSGYTEIDAPAVAGSNTLVLPTGAGSANQFLKNGATAGSLGWSSLVEDSSGRLLVGTSTSDSFYNSGVQVTGIGGSNAASQLFSRFSNDSTSPALYFQKSRGASVGTNALVGNGDDIALMSFYAANGSSVNEAARIKVQVDGTPGVDDMPGRLVFSTTADGSASPTERMRIGNSGTANFYANTDVVLSRSSTGAGISNVVFGGYHSATSTLNGTASFFVTTNGNVTNTNNSYGAISDAKLKENIVDAGSQWSDLKALEVRKYNLKAETGQQTHTQIGLVAQEAELVSPGLVYETPDRDAEGNDLGTVTKGVNYSVLYMKAVKALQEAMERIEALEADVAQLKGA